MATQTNAPNLSINAGASLVRWRFVKADGTYCGVSATRTHVGVTQEDQATSGSPVSVRMPQAGTLKVEAAGAIAAAAAVFYDTNGRVGTTSASNTQVGVALQAASGAGSMIEIQPFG